MAGKESNAFVVIVCWIFMALHRDHGKANNAWKSIFITYANCLIASNSCVKRRFLLEFVAILSGLVQPMLFPDNWFL